MLLSLAVLPAGVALGPRGAAADRAEARALVEEGGRLLSSGAPDAARKRFERAIEADPDYLPAYDAVTEIWLAAERFDLVIGRLARVTLRQPRHAPAWYALAFAYRRTGRHDLAALCYAAYIELRPAEPDPYFGLAMASLELGQHGEARAALERYLLLERRDERSDFADRARFELARLRGDRPSTTLAQRIASRLRELARAGRALLQR